MLGMPQALTHMKAMASCKQQRQGSEGSRRGAREFWGKRREADWQARARAGGAAGPSPPRQSDGTYTVHPCAHLAWTAIHRGDSTWACCELAVTDGRYPPVDDRQDSAGSGSFAAA